eukprot:750378-Hanusia_phi.AAC.3
MSAADRNSDLHLKGVNANAKGTSGFTQNSERDGEQVKGMLCGDESEFGMHPTIAQVKSSLLLLAFPQTNIFPFLSFK